MHLGPEVCCFQQKCDNDVNEVLSSACLVLSYAY